MRSIILLSVYAVLCSAQLGPKVSGLCADGLSLCDNAVRCKKAQNAVLEDGKKLNNKAELACNPAIIANHTCAKTIDWRDEAGDMNLLADEMKQATNGTSKLCYIDLFSWGINPLAGVANVTYKLKKTNIFYVPDACTANDRVALLHWLGSDGPAGLCPTLELTLKCQFSWASPQCSGSNSSVL